MAAAMTVNFHWYDRAHVVVTLQEGQDAAALSLFFTSAADAYAFAAAVMTGAEHLEAVEQRTKPDPERPWIDVSLPLFEDAGEQLAGGVTLDSSVEAVIVGANLAIDTARAARERAEATAEAWRKRQAWPPAARIALDPGEFVECLAVPEECAQVGCADEWCPRF